MGYSPERRSAVLKRMLPPNNMAIRQLAQEEGISAATLHKWRAQARGKGQLLPDADAGPEGWSSRDKFAAVLETAALNEADMAEYCRKRGLRSRPGVWPRMTSSTARLGKAPRKRRGGSRISLRAKTEHWRKLQRCLFCEKRHQRFYARIAPLPCEAITAGARRAKACAALEISEPCGAGRKAVRSGLIIVATPGTGTNALPCWRPVIQRNFPPATNRSCLTWPVHIFGIEFLPHSAGRWAAASPRRAKPAVRRKPPTLALPDVTWDITWMPGPVSGMFLYAQRRSSTSAPASKSSAWEVPAQCSCPDPAWPKVEC